MSGNLGYLFAAFAVTWLMIGGYLFYLNTQVRGLQEELEDLEERKQWR